MASTSVVGWAESRSDTLGLAVLGDQWTKQVLDLGTLGYSCAWSNGNWNEMLDKAR